MKRLGITAVVPAFNEEKTIGAVLSVLRASPLIDEILVIDDGSTDRTAEIARSSRVRVITQKNQGKAAAMRMGAQSALSPHILFADADLVGLREDHILSLAAPVLDGAVSMTIGLRDRGVFWNSLMATLLPKIGGERVVSRRTFLEMAHDAKGFGIESAMNAYCRKNNLSVLLVPLPGVMHTLKEKKYGLVRGVFARAQMIMQVCIAEIKALK